MSAKDIQQHFTSVETFLESIPGGSILIRYIKSSYQNDPARSIVELTLLLLAIRYFMSSKTSPDSKNKNVVLSEKEIDDLCKNWKPEPLIEPFKKSEIYKLQKIPLIGGPIKLRVDITDKSLVDKTLYSNDFLNPLITNKNLTNVLNLTGNDFLNLSFHKTLIKEAEDVIKNHGVGSCGPAGFYGNQDIHIKLEKKLSEWFGTDDAIIYGQDFCSAFSVVLAFLKRGDIAIVDSGINVSLQAALVLSRCQVIYYKHNDMDHLESILEELQEDLKDIKPLNRRFIVSEGLFANYGDYPDLARLVDLKKKFKFRLFMDESLSVGVLGENGRGISDFYNIPSKEIDILVCSMANSLASSGGFCVGVKPMVFNQRIASPAYCFSASLPPFSAQTASAAIDIIHKGKSNAALNKNSKLFHKLFKSDKKLTKYVEVISNELSPIVIIQLNKNYKQKIGLKPYYVNNSKKVAIANEKSLAYYDEQSEINSTTSSTSSSSSIEIVEKVSNERKDYYSDACLLQKLTERTNKIIQSESVFSEQETFNLEEFLIVKIANDLLNNDRVLVTSNQRTFNSELLRVTPSFRVTVSKDLTIQEIEDTVDKFSTNTINFLSKINSISDIKKLTG